MEDELLKELDSILQPAISKSWANAKRNAYGSDPQDAFLDLLKVQIDNTRVDLSKILYKIDLSMTSCSSTSVEYEADEFDVFFPTIVNELPEVTVSDYIKETVDGYEVWDGMRWIPTSKQANFKVDVFQNPENNNIPAVRVWAHDIKTKTNVLFIDNDIVQPGWDLSMTNMGDFGESNLMPLNGGGYWEDPMYNIAKNSTALGGITAGVMELRHVGNITPWRTGDAFKLAEGWYRNKEGIYENLNKQRGRGAGGYQKSANRALKSSKVFSRLGKLCFGASIVYSGYGAYDAFDSNDSNQKEVYTKATVDIVIGAIGVWGGPIGWVVAGTYFILDVSGALGDWGQPSGISQSEYDYNLTREIRQKYGHRMRLLEFDCEYIHPKEHQIKEMYLEERTVKRDNTRVAMPKILFKKD